MKLKKTQKLLLIAVPQYALYIFFILNIIAMIVYPGSTYLDHSSKAYSFINNFLSDLGRTLSFSGASNFLSCQLFNMALILTGTVFVLFFIQLKNVFQDNRRMKILSIIGSVFGVLGGFCLAGVGLTPSDLYLDLHIIFAN